MTNNPKKKPEKRKRGAGMATLDELCDQALAHYQQISVEASHWNSLIPKAIECYRNHQSTINQEVKEAEITVLKEIARRLDSIVWAHQWGDYEKDTEEVWKATRRFLEELNQKIRKELEGRE